MGAVAIALLFAALALAGCVGGSGQPGPDAGDAGPTADGSDDQNTSPTDGTDGTGDGSGIDDGSGDEDDGSSDDDVAPPPRTPADALKGHEPAETQPGMAYFQVEGSLGPSTPYCDPLVGVVCGNPVHAADSYEIHNAGDLTFFDVYLEHDADDVDITDYDMYLYNASGGEMAHSASPGANEYVFWSPAEGANETYTLDINAWLNAESSYTLHVWAWTVEDWDANHPFTDVFTKSYEWGQAEVAQVGSVTAGLPDPAGTTSDGRIDLGGYIWAGCGGHGGGDALLPCPREPYVSVSVVIDDDVAGQEVGAIFTTCVVDGDFTCGETDNVNSTDPGPNEIRASFCGVVNGITNDATDDRDGTGAGIWDQRGEEYKDADGNYQPHPGVEDVVVFLRGPQRGGGAICPDANPYTGPVTGTITLIGFKG